MRLNLSAWQTGALLSVIALVSHGSGAVNMDGLNPLLAAGCAHQPGSRLTVRHHRSLGIFDRSITLKPSHKVRLFLTDGSHVEGQVLKKVLVASKGRTSNDPTRGVPSIEPGAASTPDKAHAIVIQRHNGRVRRIRFADIHTIGFVKPRDGWKYASVGALVGAVPLATIGAYWSQNGFSRMGFVNSILWTTTCAGMGGIPGGAVGGLASFLPSARFKAQLGSEWILE